MKSIKFLLSTLTILALCMSAHRVRGAITFNEIYGFVNYDSVNGYNSQAALVQHSNGYLYGTTCSGGANNEGTIFGLSTNGNVFSTLTSFNLNNGGYLGGGYIAGPIQGTDGNLYGTTMNGGANLAGEVYQEAGSGLNVLYSFTGGNDGDQPYAGLVQGADGNFYGTTTAGGYYTFLDPNNIGYGTVFTITPAGSLSTLHWFNGSDGFDPRGNLLQGKDGNLYGTTVHGGAYGYGTVFKITTNGIFNTLYSFTGGGDGAWPFAGLVQGTDNNLYGTTYYRGAFTSSDSSGNGYGTIFKITTSGTLTTLASFNDTNGANPNSTLVLGTDGNVYGATDNGLYNGSIISGYVLYEPNFGSIFQMTPAGVITTLVSFDSNDGYGASPNGLIQGKDGGFYGTCQNGGTYFGASGGIVFRLSVPSSTSGSNTITVSASPINGGTVSGGGAFATGTSKTVKAIANKGYVFTSWTENGVVVGTLASYTFTLNNNRNLVANFVVYVVPDKKKPTVAITSPKTNEKWLNSGLLLMGTAKDNDAVAGVYYSLNGSNWTLASTANNWANWMASVTLIPGVNTVEAEAFDTSGNTTYTKIIKFNYVVYAPLTVLLNGNGKVSPDDNGKELVVGTTYSLKATPSKGYQFVNWSGSTNTTSATLKFIMQPNLTFTASFAPKP